MTTKWLKPNNGKFSSMVKDKDYKQKAIGTFSVPKICIEKEEAQLESHSKSEIEAISDHKKKVSKTWSKIILFYKSKTMLSS